MNTRHLIALVVILFVQTTVSAQKVAIVAKALIDGTGMVINKPAVLITNDKELQRLNAAFLGKDYATDVLSFPFEGPGIELGEIAISAQLARIQSKEFSHTVEQEISILMLHGVLHLQGMDHQADRGKMRRAETKWRLELGLPQGLIERTKR